jgi:hypothetical protein
MDAIGGDAKEGEQLASATHGCARERKPKTYTPKAGVGIRKVVTYSAQQFQIKMSSP